MKLQEFLETVIHSNRRTLEPTKTHRGGAINDYWSNYDGVPLVESSPSWLSESRRTSLDNSNRSSPAPSSQLGELNEQANNAVTPPEWENDLHQLLTANDIDFDTLWCSEYITAIHDFQRDIEPEAQVPAQHMARQTDVNIFMRAILVDWLVKVHYEFKYTPETLFLCVNILDRYLANEPVTRLQFQLVGLAAMCLAAKYEEICSPLIQDLVYIAAKAFDSHQIFDMELKILSSLSFNLSVPTASHFLAGTLQAAGADKICGHLASFLAEMSLPEYWMVEFGGSVIAAAAVYTALETLGRERFPEGLREYCGLTEREIKPAARRMVRLHRRAPNARLRAVYRKYTYPKYMEVARLPPALSLLDCSIRPLRAATSTNPIGGADALPTAASASPLSVAPLPPK